MTKWIRNIFLTGLLTLLPVYVTYLLIRFIVVIAPDLPYLRTIPLFQEYEILAKLIEFIGAIIFIFIIGLIINNVVGKKLFSFFENIMERVPLINTIYVSSRQIMQTLTLPAKGNFKQVVYIEYPRKDLWTIAFVTAYSKSESEEKYVHVFLPTTPNPTSGFMLFVKAADIRPSGLTIEDGLKTLISGGQNTIGFEFINPWITGDHVSFQLGIGSNIYTHTFLPYDVNSKQIQMTLGKYLNHKIRAKVGFKFVDKKYTNESLENNYRYFNPFLQIRYDTRNLYSNPSSGMMSSNKLGYQFDATGSRNNRFVWNQSTSYFTQLIGGNRNTVGGVNLESLLSFDKNVDVWNNYLGGAFTIRGWDVPNANLYSNGDQDYRFGRNWITASAEIRQTIIPKFATKLDNEFGLSLALFTDVGLINDNISDIFDQSPLIGVGIGLRVPWPVVQSFRLDYGWSFYEGDNIGQSLHLAFGEKF